MFDTALVTKVCSEPKFFRTEKFWTKPVFGQVSFSNQSLGKLFAKPVWFFSLLLLPWVGRKVCGQTRLWAAFVSQSLGKALGTNWDYHYLVEKGFGVSQSLGKIALTALEVCS